MSRLHDLYEQAGQSPWIDDLKRSYLTSGGLRELIDHGIRGMTSNPTIMAKAIEEGSDYDEQFASLISAGTSVDDAYWDLVIDDVQGALGEMRSIYDESNGGDGFVSLEVAPSLAHDTAGTVGMAKHLHERINEPNLFVKIPATVEGVPAIEEMISLGHSINVTLIFSLDRYAAVIEAYLHGLERFATSGGDIAKISSVASFFVSRVDTEVDRRLEQIAQANPDTPRAVRAHELRGKAAIAQAKLAYDLYHRSFTSDRFKKIAGARTQRPLWASTSTKNPEYPDLYYVENLIGPDSVDTMPDATVEAFLDHGHVQRTVDVDVDDAREVIDGLAEVGIDIEEVTVKLEDEGVASFAKSFDELIDELAAKASTLGAK